MLERIFPPSTSSQARQGCSNNPLEVFSFLAFGLYLVNLAMGLGGGGRRRRRSTKSQDLCQEDDISDRPELMQSIMAFTEMFRAYLAVDDLSGEAHIYIFSVLRYFVSKDSISPKVCFCACLLAHHER